MRGDLLYGNVKAKSPVYGEDRAGDVDSVVVCIFAAQLGKETEVLLEQVDVEEA